MKNTSNAKTVLQHRYTNGESSNFQLIILKRLLYLPVGKKFMLKLLKNRMYKSLVLDNKTELRNVQLKKYQMLVAALDTIFSNIERGYISKKFAEKTFDNFLNNSFAGSESVNEIKKRFEGKYGQRPPWFIVLAPTQKCGLKCTGCYASATLESAPTLSYDVIDRIVNEVYNEWGSRFMTITGGEPLMYKSNGKTLFDIWEKYPGMFFQFYTNGVMITREAAQKLAHLSNVIPSISIEGYEKETDERRGKGVFSRVIQATKNLKEVGVPFGVSITATSKNFDILMEDRFYDYVFKELGATFMWMFQLMPVGQACDMRDCMITPQQRVKLFRKWEYLLKEKKYPVADFWNSGVLVNGCIAYGKEGNGYVYVDWNGNIMPCVFAPYYEDNILELFKKGKGLTDALFSDLFKNGRKWQKEYGADNPKLAKNWLMPCSIRDHFENFSANILTKKSKPEDTYAAHAMKSKEYKKILMDFDKEVEEATLPIWKKEFLEEESS